MRQGQWLEASGEKDFTGRLDRCGGAPSDRNLYELSVSPFFSLDRSPIRQLSAIQVEIPSLGNTHRLSTIQATMKMMRSQRFSMIPPNRRFSRGRVNVSHAFP